MRASQRFGILGAGLGFLFWALPAWANTNTAITAWLPTTPMFLSAYGGGARQSWTGHSVICKDRLGSPRLYVIGGEPNTFNAYADGNGDTSNPPAAFSTIQQAALNPDHTLQTWSADVSTNGIMPLASILHTSILDSHERITVIAGANSCNAQIFCGAPSRSNTAFYTGQPLDWYIGQACVFYEAGASPGTDGVMTETSFLPVQDPGNANIHQPLIRAAGAAAHGYLYVLGGISRQNLGPGDNPTGSVARAEDRVWYCCPNPSGTINAEGMSGTWAGTASLPRALYNHSACVAYNRLYVLGGQNSSAAVQNQVYVAEFQSNGTLGAWQATSPLPLARAEASAVFAGNYIYVVAGTGPGGEAANTVFRCHPDPATGLISTPGQAGAWEETDAPLPSALAGPGAAADAAGFLYVLGGRQAGVSDSNAHVSSFNTSTATPTAAGTPPRQPALDAFRAFPNPAKSKVRFVWPGETGGRVRVSIYNLTGERIANIQASSPAQSLVWETQGAARGVYVYEIVLDTPGGTSKGRGKIALIH
jgi:hypothetical protein